MKTKIAIVLILCLALLPQTISAAGTLQRYMVVVGANSGGSDRGALKYAVSDAERFAEIMVRMGGVDEANHIVLRQPAHADIETAFANLAKKISKELSIPTIGIGAGPFCDGQVLVLHDVIGMFDRFVPKFVKRYANIKENALDAIRKYKKEVEKGKFPSDEQSFK